jgi:rRNA maturation protein Nop10
VQDSPFRARDAINTTEVHMAFWDAWFKPICSECGEKIIEPEPPVFEDRKMHDACKDKILEARRIKEVETAARREAEDAARAKFEDRKEFGTDPRYD